MPDTRDTRPLYTPPSTTPAMPDTPGFIERPRHARIDKGYAAHLSDGKEKGHRATQIWFLAEKVEQVEERQKWLASADAIALAATVRQALEQHNAGSDYIIHVRRRASTGCHCKVEKSDLVTDK